MTKPTKADEAKACWVWERTGGGDSDVAVIAQALADARAEEREECLMDIFGAIGPNDGGAIHIRNVRKVIRARGGAA